MPTLTNRYGSIAAEIYDIDKPFGALPDTAFHLARLADITGPILEPACGSGRTLVPLLQAGHEMVGFDPSAEMLAQCEQRCRGAGFSADLSCQRFEDFTYERTFAAILVPAGSFTLIDDFAIAMATLRRFNAHLDAGGLLILDMQPLSFLASRSDDLRSWTAANGDLLTVEGRAVKTDWLAQRMDYRIRYERWRDGELVESQLEPMAQRFWGREETRMALEQAGFGEVRAVGGYDRGRAPRSGDRVLTYEAVKM